MQFPNVRGSLKSFDTLKIRTIYVPDSKVNNRMAPSKKRRQVMKEIIQEEGGLEAYSRKYHFDLYTSAFNMAAYQILQSAIEKLIVSVQNAPPNR